jgi:uncharacterized membrane protein
MEKSKTSTGLEENVAGLLCYLLGFITGILFFVLEKENTFVRFHAMQSIITFGTIFVLSFILGFIPIIGWILALLLPFVALILWIILMVKAYQGARYKLPIVGDIAEKQVSPHV